MRRFNCILLLFLLSIALNGCSTAKQVENQAYVLTMGIDRCTEGLEITVQVPRIASSGEQENAPANGGGKYFRFSARGDSFENVLEKLDWIIPRSLNLSHLKLIVLSRELASDGACRQLLYDIEHTERLFSAARVAVCDGRAADFIEKTKPVVGNRLSTDILSTFDHYINQGLVPDSNLAELYYTTQSVYSDPMAVYAVFTQPDSEDQNPDPNDKIAQMVAATQSDIPTHYIGAAVFSEGVCKGVFDASETIFANLLRGSVKSFRYYHDGQGLEIFPSGSAKLQIDTNAQPMTIRIGLKLNISAQEEVPDLEGLQKELEEGVLAVIEKARKMGAEPFGLAEAAAKQFLTLDDWIGFGWIDAFSQAATCVEISLKRSGT